MLNRSVWSWVAFDIGPGNRPPACPSTVEDVEGTSPKSDEIVESNRSVVGLVWLGSAVMYVDATFGLVVVAGVSKVWTESVVVCSVPIVA